MASAEKETTSIKENDKKEKPRVVQLIRKSNNLVEGKYRFDIWEMRVFTKTLTMIHKDDEDFRPYRIYLKDIISEFGLEQNKQSYKLLKEGAEKLARREIRMIVPSPEGEMELFTHIAAGVKSFTNHSAGKYIEVSFHPDMKPHLLQLQTQFLMYDIKNILRLQSSFSVRIYELLKQYERIGRRTFTLDELKDILDIKDKYPLYANFKQRVIVKAQEDLEKYTDIWFTFEEQKQGKAVWAITFFIEKNKKTHEEGIPSLGILTATLPEVVEKERIPELDELIVLLEGIKGVNEETLLEWIKQYPIQHIRERIGLVKNQIAQGSKIRNPMGYLQRIMAQVNLFDSLEEERHQKKQQVVKQATSALEIKTLEKELEELQIGYYERQYQVIEDALETDAVFYQEIYAGMRSHFAYDPRMGPEQNLRKEALQAWVIKRLRQISPNLFHQLDADFEYREKNLKTKLRLLGWNG